MSELKYFIKYLKKENFPKVERGEELMGQNGGTKSNLKWIEVVKNQMVPTVVQNNIKMDILSINAQWYITKLSGSVSCLLRSC